MRNNEKTREAQEIFDRILTEMERQEKKYAQLIKFLDLPRGTFSSWKAGRSRNFCEHLYSISLFLDVDPGWLITGEIKADVIKDKKEKELVCHLRKLSAKKQDAVIQNAKWLAE